MKTYPKIENNVLVIFATLCPPEKATFWSPNSTLSCTSLRSCQLSWQSRPRPSSTTCGWASCLWYHFKTFGKWTWSTWAVLWEKKVFGSGGPDQTRNLIPQSAVLIWWNTFNYMVFHEPLLPIPRHSSPPQGSNSAFASWRPCWRGWL